MSWSNSHAVDLASSLNFLLFDVTEVNGKKWNVCFVYGAPKFQDRSRVWVTLYDLLVSYPNCILVGDSNQLEFHAMAYLLVFS